ncbi:Sucrose synthase 5, partial [Bienertia sinuspersici]
MLNQQKLMINDTLNTPAKLQAAVVVTDVFLSSLSPDTPFQNFELRFKEWGFEKGWGDTAGRAPNPVNVERFFSKLPSIFNVVIFSVHGCFGKQMFLACQILVA